MKTFLRWMFGGLFTALSILVHINSSYSQSNDTQAITQEIQEGRIGNAFLPPCCLSLGVSFSSVNNANNSITIGLHLSKDGYDTGEKILVDMPIKKIIESAKSSGDIKSSDIDLIKKILGSATEISRDFENNKVVIVGVNGATAFFNKNNSFSGFTKDEEKTETADAVDEEATPEEDIRTSGAVRPSVSPLDLIGGGGKAVGKGIVKGVTKASKKLNKARLRVSERAKGHIKVQRALSEETTRPSEGQLANFRRQLKLDGRNKLLKSRRKLQRRLNEHVEKIKNPKSGRYTSSMESEITNFKQQIRAIHEVLGE